MKVRLLKQKAKYMKSYGTTGNGTIETESYNDYLEDIKPVERDPLDREYVTIEQEVEEEPYNPMAYARDTVDTLIVQSDYFIKQAHEKGIDLGDTSSTEYLRHLYDMTNEYLDQHDSKEFFTGIDGGETYHLIRLFGVAPYAIRQQAALDAAEANGNKNGAKTAKSAVITLNHTLFNLAEANPKRKLTELAEEVEKATTFYDATAKGYAYNVMLQSSFGVRTEFGFWQALNYRSNPDFSLRHGTTEEDKKGIDFVATLQSLQLAIDIKSSLQQVIAKTWTHNPTEKEPYTKTEDGQFIYCPQTTDASFVKGSFELDLGEKIKLRNTILEHLHKMAKL